MADVDRSRLIQGVATVRLDSWPDERGRFAETFRRSWIPEAAEMVQANRSDSVAGVLRGLHYHLLQADYWYVTAGRMFTALCDLRASSPTRGAVETLEMGEGNDVGLYIPPGVAHGFLALTDVTLTYLVDRYFDPTDELGVRFDDPGIGIPWPAGERILSDRDRTNPSLADVAPERLPR